ncbi:MAG: type II toxin-antitoxin system prevent-host-death family antitoxin [Gemmataceae bacterium]|nr:type II toxin-antitoxin system prevent-host-death family antitoxin [Gemmataceae bacterium]
METTLSKLRSNLKRYADQAMSQRIPIRVRRRSGGDLILMSADEYDSLAETAHLVASPRNAARLLAALARARKTKGTPMTVEELRAACGL